jgi:hypothetical protein
MTEHDEPSEAPASKDDTSPSNPGLDALRALQGILVGSDKALHQAAWASVQRAETLNAIAESYLHEETTTSSYIAALEVIAGNARHARALRSAVKKMCAEKKRALLTRVTDDDDGGGPLPSLGLCLGIAGPPPSVVDNTMLEQLRVPRGYAVDGTGVWKMTPGPDGDPISTKIASVPIFIVGRTHDVLTGEAKRQVAWRTPAGWTVRAIPRGVLMNSQKLIMLADLEAPVTSNTSALLVGFLSEFEAENMHRFGASQAASRMGWVQQHGVNGFLLPGEYYTPTEGAEPMELLAPEGMDNLIEGWRPAGSWEGWLAAVDNASDFAPMWVALYAAAAAPLLEIVGCTSFIVDFCGETTGGKTTALRLAASVWGRPSDNGTTAMYSWDSTKVFIERVCGFLCHLPVILDETKRAKSPQVVRDVIYDFANGQGKGRGSIAGTRATASWRTVMLTSGESAATGFSQDAGTRARVLSIEGKPLGHDRAVGGPAAEAITRGVLEHHGHLGRKVATYLVSIAQQQDDLRRVWEQTRDHYALLARSAVSRRHAQYLATLHLAAEIVHSLGVPRPRCGEPLTLLLEAVKEAEIEADRPLAALTEVATWCAANQTKFWGRHEMDRDGNPRHPSKGWIGTWDSSPDWKYIAVLPSTLREILEGPGYGVDEVLSRWQERGWLFASSPGSTRTRVVRVQGEGVRTYCISRAACELALLDPAERHGLADLVEPPVVAAQVPLGGMEELSPEQLEALRLEASARAVDEGDE